MFEYLLNSILFLFRLCSSSLILSLFILCGKIQIEYLFFNSSENDGISTLSHSKYVEASIIIFPFLYFYRLSKSIALLSIFSDTESKRESPQLKTSVVFENFLKSSTLNSLEGEIPESLDNTSEVNFLEKIFLIRLEFGCKLPQAKKTLQ